MREKLEFFRPKKGEEEPKTEIEKAVDLKLTRREFAKKLGKIGLVLLPGISISGCLEGLRKILQWEEGKGVDEKKKEEEEEKEAGKLEVEKEMKEIRQGLMDRLKELTTKVNEMEGNNTFAIERFSSKEGVYEVTVSKDLDLSYLGNIVAESALDPPLMQKYENQNVTIEGGGGNFSTLNVEFSGRNLPDNLLEHFDNLLEKAKKEKNSEEVLSLLNRLFSSSATLSFPEGCSVELSEEERNDPVAAYEKFTKINKTEITEMVKRTPPDEEVNKEIWKGWASYEKFNKTVRWNGLAAYEEFKRLNATEKKDTRWVKDLGNKYKTAIQKSLAGIYSAKVLELYLPQGEVKFYSKFEDVYGKPKVKDFELLDKAPETRAYLSDFYKNVLKLPIPSTLKEAKK